MPCGDFTELEEDQIDLNHRHYIDRIGKKSSKKSSKKPIP